MRNSLKLFFDENIGTRLYRALSALLKLSKRRNIETAHLIVDYYGKGLWDESWIPNLVGEGWIVISADRGSGSRKKGKPLPIVCRENAITHVLISGKLHNKEQLEKACAILDVREKLFELDNEPKGTRFLLYAARGNSASRLKKNKILCLKMLLKHHFLAMRSTSSNSFLVTG